jgi:geranylgeranyl diphosphate synthase type II
MYKTLIEQELQKLTKEYSGHTLYTPIKYILEIGGKRIRPALVLQTTEVFGGKKEEAIPLALAVEVFHNFTLMHDDIMDKSNLRRGVETVHKKWDVNSAILSGDAMMIMAYSLINKLPVTYQAEVFSEFNKMSLLLCEGQQDDMRFETENEVELTEYLEMIKKKTSVLIAFCLKAGAIVAGADSKTQELIYDFGINLGLAFQLQDDYLDLYPKSKKMGKIIGGDLLNNKKSLPYLIALKESSNEQIINIETLINSNNNNRVNELITVFSTLDVKAKCNDIIKQYFNKAIADLDAIKNYDTSSFLNFANELFERES